MKKIAITGGPCAGKSSVLSFLQHEYEGKILVMREAASHLFDNFFPLAGRDLSFTPEWADALQSTILPVQLNTEKTWMLAVKERRIPVLVTDRGVMDGAAYVGGPAVFAERFGLNLAEIHASYDMVIHIESLATGNPKLFEQQKANNPHRRESRQEAEALEYRTREAWTGHPNWKLVTNSGSLESMQAKVLNLLSPFLEVEVERKFYLPSLPKLRLPEPIQIRQGYLGTDAGEIRLRWIGEQYFLTIKRLLPDSLANCRREWERRIPADIFYYLWKQTEGRQVHKLRYKIPCADYLLELDVFQDLLEGLVLLECECPDEDTAAVFQLPDWAAGAIEVTNYPLFSNRKLAFYGLPSGF